MLLSSFTAAVLTSLVLSTSALAQGQGQSSSHSGMHGGQSSQAMMGHGAMESSPNAAKAPFDLQFLDTMSAHHQSAIEMAQLVEDRSAHDELKQMAKKMIDVQQGEIKQMQEWKQRWYTGKGDAVNTKMPGMMESMKGMSMEKLEASKGDAFDAMFLNMMSKHHQGAVKMAQSALTKAQHKEIKELSKKVVDDQKKEIAQMAKWKKDWKLASK